MNWFEELIVTADNDPYLSELIVKAEMEYAEHFLQVESINQTSLTDKELTDLLRFADILCRGQLPESRNKAYKIISLLYEKHRSDAFYQMCANTVLTKLGIFPTMALLSQNDSLLANPEISLERCVKEVYQSSPLDGKVFTDAQYSLFEKMKNSNHYSFSGPTSFGKSFIMEAFISHIISERNASDNIVILVPTRALINQVSLKLKQEIIHPNYRILTHPVVPEMYRRSNFKYIFIFTPERWISYLSENANPIVTYMFVDEAQKVVSQKDSRSPLYYHAILLAERKSVKLYFASPNIPNAEIFLQLFEKSMDESMVIKDSPVAQNRFYFDFIENKAVLFSETGDDIPLPYDFTDRNHFLTRLLLKIGHDHQNIVYCNTIDDTIHFALHFSKRLPVKKSEKLDNLITLIKGFVHKDYYLIDCLKHGVAFHFGRLPQRIREQVELLFSDGEIDYVFCTSTLLEGVNLPAKNIFILNNAIGMTKFSDIDFWNLAGRAGRLSKELSGNIICVRADNKKNRWDDPEKDLKIVRNRKLSNVEPSVIAGEKNFYTNLGNAIENVPFTRKNASQAEIDIWNHYSNILCIHQIGKNDSILINSFLKKNTKAKKILSTVSKTNRIPVSILEQSSSIKLKYQNALWDNPTISTLPAEVSPDSCRKILDILYDTYNWREEESTGRNPMTRDRTRLQYFSNLMYSWVQGKPLNMIINNLINYYKKKGQIFYQGKYYPFDASNRDQINHVINELMSDIDNALRFKIKNYLVNYTLILKAKQLDDGSSKWVDYMEYGTTDSLIIGLQTLGIPRHLAMFIVNEHSECITIEDSQIIGFDIPMLQARITPEEHPDEYKELSVLLNW